VDSRRTTCLHEAAHACVLMHFGCPINDLIGAGPGEPITMPARWPGPEERIVVAYAGYVTGACAGPDDLSGSDAALIERAAVELGIVIYGSKIRYYRDRASTLTGRLWQEIDFLADALDRSGRLDRHGIAALCRRPGSPLSRFAALYDVPRSKPRPTAVPTSDKDFEKFVTALVAPSRVKGIQRVRVDGCCRH
jgi:hypothetical protein